MPTGDPIEDGFVFRCDGVLRPVVVNRMTTFDLDIGPCRMTEPSLGTAAVLALLPLSGVIGGFVAQSLIASRAVYIGSITAERSKWIDKLRANLSGYYSLSSSVVHRRNKMTTITDDEIKRVLTKERYGDLQKLEKLASLLRLQLNPDGQIDGNVIAIIEELQAHQDDDDRDMSANRDLLLSHSQWLLKLEWEKVKWEASGMFHRLLNRRFEAVRLKKYALWVGSTPATERVGWPARLRSYAEAATASQ